MTKAGLNPGSMIRCQSPFHGTEASSLQALPAPALAPAPG